MHIAIEMGSIMIKSVLLLSFIGGAFCSENEGDSFKIRTKRKLDIVLSSGETNDTQRHIYRQTPIKNPFGVKLYSSRQSSTKINSINTTEPVDYRIRARPVNERYRFKFQGSGAAGGGEDGERDISPADSTNGKTIKENSVRDDDEEEKTLSQQVADGKYGLIQNEIFANGSRRPGILSYSSNSEVPKDTKENLGGLEKDEIWLAEDHILVLRGGKYGDAKDNDSSSIWPPIDDYTAPNRQVKIPKHPKIAPPFPIRLTDNGPLQFIKGEVEPDLNAPFLLPFPLSEKNTSVPFPYGVPPNPLDPRKNQTLVLPFLPPFLANFPPGATFVAPPPPNATDIDEDDPSIYYPPKYDFHYPRSNTGPVPAGPLVPGIILPPPPDFFGPLENETRIDKNETDISYNTIVRPPFQGPKYLPLDNKQSTKLKTVLNNRNFKRPFSNGINEIGNQLPKTPTEPGKPLVTYVFPENVKSDPSKTKNSNNNLKVPPEENVKVFDSPTAVTTKSKERPIYYHPLPTTSPKPNHITVPTTLSKDIYIVTTPEAEQNNIQDLYKSAKPGRKPVVYQHVSPELHPLRSLIRPNVSVSYTGKYGHLPATTSKPFPTPGGKQFSNIAGHYITQPPPEITQNTITSTPNVNVTPVPIVKKIRIRPLAQEKKNPSLTTKSPSKATLYFYEEPSKTEAPKEIIQLIETTKQTAPNKPEPNKEVTTPLPQYQNPPIQSAKIPVRQFLEETFHASGHYQAQNPRINSAEISSPNIYPANTKIKSPNLQYESHSEASPTPLLGYHYVTEVPPIIIPRPKIKSLEIQNSGSTGLQKVNLAKGTVRTIPKPFFMQQIFPSPKPESPIQFTTVKPNIPLPITDNTPFIPSNYYATSRPDHLHFTSQEQTLVDDITKNYFTIFGQKISSGSTTPLAPVKSIKPNINSGKNLEIIPENNLNNHNRTVPTPPPSHFEQYLKEITGEDQREYIVSDIQGKVKKGKGFLSFAALPGVFPTPLYPYRVEPSLPQYPNIIKLPKIIYPPNYSTTLRPVVEVNPQYIRHSTPRPLPIQTQKVPLSHNLGQYLQEITAFTSPKPPPIKINKNRPTRLLVSPSQKIKDVEIRNPSSPTIGITDRPLSLESDIIINFKHSLPPVNRDAEPVDLKTIRDGTFKQGSNIKIVESPDLTKEQNNNNNNNNNNFESAKHFFQNLPQSGYFSPTYQPTTNSFVSYNLPGNGGHFYFLTPQILEKSHTDQRIQNRGNKYNLSQIPIRTQTNSNSHKNNFRRNYSTELGHNLTNDYSNHDYLRRRRKKS